MTGPKGTNILKSFHRYSQSALQNVTLISLAISSGERPTSLTPSGLSSITVCHLCQFVSVTHLGKAWLGFLWRSVGARRYTGPHRDKEVRDTGPTPGQKLLQHTASEPGALLTLEVSQIKLMYACGLGLGVGPLRHPGTHTDTLTDTHTGTHIDTETYTDSHRDIHRDIDIHIHIH